MSGKAAPQRVTAAHRGKLTQTHHPVSGLTRLGLRSSLLLRHHPAPQIVMAGLVPAKITGTSPVMTEGGRRARTTPKSSIVKHYYVYILASRPGGALYVGVTNNLIRRVREHRIARVARHTAKYAIDKLVYFEIFDSAHAAIQREKNIKHWPRAWKTRTIAASNPTWRDLYDEIV